MISETALPKPIAAPPGARLRALAMSLTMTGALAAALLPGCDPYPDEGEFAAGVVFAGNFLGHVGGAFDGFAGKLLRLVEALFSHFSSGVTGFLGFFGRVACDFLGLVNYVLGNFFSFVK